MAIVRLLVYGRRHAIIIKSKGHLRVLRLYPNIQRHRAALLAFGQARCNRCLTSSRIRMVSAWRVIGDLHGGEKLCPSPSCGNHITCLR
jgi:hypothetical protein